MLPGHVLNFNLSQIPYTNTSQSHRVPGSFEYYWVNWWFCRTWGTPDKITPLAFSVLQFNSSGKGWGGVRGEADISYKCWICDLWPWTRYIWQSIWKLGQPLHFPVTGSASTLFLIGPFFKSGAEMLSCKSLLSCMETNKIMKASICMLWTQSVMKLKQLSLGMMLFKCQAGLWNGFNGGKRNWEWGVPVLSSRAHQRLLTLLLCASWPQREWSETGNSHR